MLTADCLRLLTNLRPFSNQTSDPLNVEILLFAGLRERIGSERVRVNLPEPTTAGDVIETLKARYPEASDLIGFSRLAVDQQYARPDDLIDQNLSELALIPPVSGG